MLEAFYNTIIKKEKENSNKKRMHTDAKYLVLCSLLILTVAFVLISLNRKTIKIRKKFNKIKKEILK